MAANTQPIFPIAPKFGSVAIAPADAQNLKTVLTAGANGSRLCKLQLISTDTAARDVGIYINGTLVGTVAVPALSGTTGALPAVDVLSNSNFKGAYLDSQGNYAIDLQASAVLTINAPVTITAAKTMTGIAVAGDF